MGRVVRNPLLPSMPSHYLSAHTLVSEEAYLEALRVMVAEGILVGVNTFDPEDGCRDEEA
jgi:hypothetical protein